MLMIAPQESQFKKIHKSLFVHKSKLFDFLYGAQFYKWNFKLLLLALPHSKKKLHWKYEKCLRREVYWICSRLDMILQQRIYCVTSSNATKVDKQHYRRRRTTFSFKLSCVRESTEQFPQIWIGLILYWSS